MWSTAVAAILSRPATSSRLDIANYPTGVNAFFLSLPVLLLGTLLPLAAVTNWHFNYAFDLYRVLDADLIAAAAAFDNGVTTGDTTQLFALLSTLSQESDIIVSQWRKVWIAWTVFNIEFVIVRVLGQVL